MVDTISSLASADYRHDEWGVDVSVGGAQKGLMLPPGLSFNAISDKAVAASRTSKLTKSFWSWEDMLALNKTGYFPYTPATNMLYGLDVSIQMLHEEGLENVFARHDRFAEAFRGIALDTFNISYGTAFGPFAGRMFRIGHLGDINDLMLMGALSGTEMALTLAGVPIKKGGAQAAMDYLTQMAAKHTRAAAE